MGQTTTAKIRWEPTVEGVRQMVLAIRAGAGHCRMAHPRLKPAIGQLEAAELRFEQKLNHGALMGVAHALRVCLRWAPQDMRPALHEGLRLVRRVDVLTVALDVVPHLPDDDHRVWCPECDTEVTEENGSDDGTRCHDCYWAGIEDDG